MARVAPILRVVLLLYFVSRYQYHGGSDPQYFFISGLSSSIPLLHLQANDLAC